MSSDVDCLHHVGLVVADLDEAAHLYRRLGFQVTPPSHHEIAAREGEPPKPLGTANQTTTFRHNFVELLAHVRDDLPDRLIQPWLDRFPGLHILTFNTTDAHALADRLAASGVGHSGVGTLQREVDTGDGRQMMRVRRLRFVEDDLPEGQVQAAENLTPELLLQPRHMDHPNGARDLVDAVICVDDGELDEVVARYEGYLGRASAREGVATVIELSIGRLTIVAASQLDALLPGELPPAVPAIVAFGIEVADLEVVRRILERNEVPFRPIGDRLMVPAKAALGGAVIFGDAR